jgi:hypothetical protein
METESDYVSVYVSLIMSLYVERKRNWEEVCDKKPGDDRYREMIDTGRTRMSQGYPCI